MAGTSFANDGSFFENFQKLQQQADHTVGEVDGAETGCKQQQPAVSAAQESASAQCSKNASPALACVDPGADSDFVASSSFSGMLEGFVFTTGGHGTGYYRDTPLHLRQKQAQAKPVVLKNNSSVIKGLQRRSIASVPDAKKRKTDSGSSKPNYVKEMERYRAMACSSDTKHDRPLVK